jgi:bleomycin hydrolase
MNRDIQWQLQRKKDSARRLLQNVVTSSPLDKILLDRSRWNRIDEEPTFTLELSPKDPKPVADQKRSGRCWVFSVINMMRIPFMRRYRLDSFRFSANYIWFWDLYEKYLFFLQRVHKYRNKLLDQNSFERYFILKEPIYEGGDFSMAKNIVEKYGIVPYSSYKETIHSEHTSELHYILNRKARSIAYLILEEDQWNIKQWSRDIFDCLCLFLGSPPLQCTFKDKDFTPLEFYQKKVMPCINLENFTTVVNDPRHAYHHRYGNPDNGNVWEGERRNYVNVSWGEMVKMILSTLRNKKVPVFICCAVDENYFSSTTVLDINLEHNFIILERLDKRAMLEMRNIKISHVMIIVGYDARKKIWKIENSWGENENMTASDAWLQANLFEIAVPKSLIPTCPKKMEIIPIFDMFA